MTRGLAVMLVVAVIAAVAVVAIGWSVLRPSGSPIAGCAPATPLPAVVQESQVMEASIEWRAATVPPELLDADAATIQGLAALDGTLVTVGSESNGPDYRAFALISTDGLTWTESGAGAWDGVDFSGGVTAVGDRLFALGSTSIDDGGSSRGSVWYSDDGATWTESTGDLGGYAVAIAGGEDGLVLIGSGFEDGGLLAWRSADGEHWVSTTFDLSVAIDVASFSDLAYDGKRWLGVGSLSRGVDQPATAVTWLSVDGGRSWECRALDSGGLDAVHASELHQAGGQWLVVGIGGKACGAGASCPGVTVAWVSSDGAHWSAPIGEVEPIAVGGVAFAGGDSAFIAARPGNTWGSIDGLAWSRLHIGESGGRLLGQTDAMTFGSHGALVVAAGTIDDAISDTDPWIAVGEVRPGD